MKNPMLLKLFIALPLSMVLMITGIGCDRFSTPNQKDTTVNHAIWSQELKKYVDDQGWVDYQAWSNQRAPLDNYLKLLSNQPPDKDSWSEDEQLAFWINAYNAFTISLILDNYPLNSITDLHPTLYVPGINTVWHKKFITMGDQTISLDEIEHQILRKQFKEPRIHFAIVCASYSCPKLRTEAYIPSALDQQLNEQAINFINDPGKNVISEEQITLSKIFKWFEGDFTRQSTLVEFLNRFTSVTIEADAKIDYMEYDWSLNGE